MVFTSTIGGWFIGWFIEVARNTEKSNPMRVALARPSHSWHTLSFTPRRSNKSSDSSKHTHRDELAVTDAKTLCSIGIRVNMTCFGP